MSRIPRSWPFLSRYARDLERDDPLRSSAALSLAEREEEGWRALKRLEGLAEDVGDEDRLEAAIANCTNADAAEIREALLYVGFFEHFHCRNLEELAKARAALSKAEYVWHRIEEITGKARA